MTPNERTIVELKTINKQLLEALVDMIDSLYDLDDQSLIKPAQAAIAKAKGVSRWINSWDHA